MEFFEIGEPLSWCLEAGFLSFEGFAKNLLGAGEVLELVLPSGRGARVCGPDLLRAGRFVLDPGRAA